MMKSKNKSHINSLSDLKKEKKKVKKQVKLTMLEMQNIFDDLPVKALGATATWMMGSVVRGISTVYDKVDEDGAYLSTNETMKDKFVSVGRDTVSFAISKLIETLFRR